MRSYVPGPGKTAFSGLRQYGSSQTEHATIVHSLSTAHCIKLTQLKRPGQE